MAAAATKYKVTTRKVKLGRPVETLALTQQRVREQIAEVAARDSGKIAEALSLAAQSDRPDVNAAKALWDYAGFKPTEKVEVGGTIGIVQLVAQLEHGDTQPA